MSGAFESLPLSDTLRNPFAELLGALRHQAHLPAAVLDLCALRLAGLHGAAPAQLSFIAPVAAPQYDNLSSWHRHPAFSEAERACLAFTEVYAQDAQAITDELADAVKSHYDDAGLVTLIEALGLLDGVIRVSLLWPSCATGDGELPGAG